MKRLLYIGHAYHQKTKSSDFMLDLLKEKYDITTFYFDPYQDDDDMRLQSLNNLQFDVVVLWQICPDINKLMKLIHCQKFIFFPMYDASHTFSNNFWYSYRNVKIINFSKTLHNKLKNMGLDSHYIQYFPKPSEQFISGDKNAVFFWQRTNVIHIKLIEKLISKIKITKVHIHKALDPKQKFVKPSKNVPFDVEYSDWYERKADMLKDIQKYQIYFAPRHLEGIGMSFLEAMAMGRCVIAPDLPTMNEYITHGENGILYDLKHPKPLNNFDAVRIGQNALSFIQEGNKVWENQKKDILNLLEERVLVDENKLSQIELRTCKRYLLFGFIPVLKIDYNRSSKKIKLLGLISVHNTRENDRNYKLFGVVPFFSIEEAENKKVWQIFKIPFLCRKNISNGHRIKYTVCGVPVLKIAVKK